MIFKNKKIQKEKIKKLFDNYNMAGYSSSPCGENHILGEGFYHHSDLLRSINFPSSDLGLFKENKNIYFWWFDKNGYILHENKCHLNNLGLVSNYKQSIDRKDKNEYRIAVLGCEMTGATTSNKSWPDYLQKFLNKSSTNSKTFQVFNFGHLDTGIHEWKTIWKKRASKFDIDLLIVNIAPHTLIRKGNIYSDVSHWDLLPGFKYCSYKISDGSSAVTWFYNKKLKNTLRDFRSYTSKLITLWTDPDVAHKPSSVKEFRNLIIDDYVNGMKIGFFDDDIDPREKNYPNIPQYSNEELLIWIKKHIEWFSNNVPNVIFTLNPWLPHFTDFMNYPFENLLDILASDLRIYDMRKSWKLWGVEEDISVLYSNQGAEKWSDRGHNLYGEAVGIQLLNNLTF